MLLYVHSSFAIILMGKRELFAFLGLSSWCLVMVVRLFLAGPWVCLIFVIVVFPDHRERCGSVVEYLTRDQEAAGSSLIGVTALWSLSKTHLSLLSTGSTQEDPFLFN